jgi:hypothetical protein
MKIRRLVPLMGLLVLAGCGDPKEYLKEAIQAELSAPFSNYSSASMSNVSCVSDGGGYRCNLTLVYKDIVGIARGKDTEINIRETGDGWRVVERDIFSGGRLM